MNWKRWWKKTIMYLKNVGISYIDKDADTIARCQKRNTKQKKKKEKRNQFIIITHTHTHTRKRKRIEKFIHFHEHRCSSETLLLYICTILSVLVLCVGYTMLVYTHNQFLEHQVNDKVFHIRHWTMSADAVTRNHNRNRLK